MGVAHSSDGSISMRFIGGAVSACSAIFLAASCASVNPVAIGDAAGEGGEAGAASARAAERMVPRAASEISIDGVLDEPDWRSSQAYPVNYVHGRLNEAEAEPLMLVRCLWDERYLYIGYETFDTNVTAYGTGEFDGPADNRRESACIFDGPATPGCDVVEFFVSWGSETYFWELHHNASNCFSDVWCVALPEGDPQLDSASFQYGIHFGRGDFVQDDRDATFACAAAPKAGAGGAPSTVNDRSDVDAGYSGEIRLPLRGIGAPLSAFVLKRGVPPAWNLEGKGMMMLAVLQNPDSGRRYHHDAPDFPGGWFHHGAAFWPRYRFCGPADMDPAAD